MKASIFKLMALGAAMTLIGCKQEPPPETKTTEEVQPAKPTPVPEAPKPAPAAVDTGLSPDDATTTVQGVPTPEDFADEAEKTVSPDNLDAELDRLEAEIGGE